MTMNLTCLDLPIGALGRRGGGMILLAQHAAVRYRGALSRAECDRLVAGVYQGRAHWTANFEGSMFTLGRAWYAHLEGDREAEYFDHVAASDAVVERCAPGLAERLRRLLGRVVAAPVGPRPGFCGPGVHIFPAGGWVAQHGGDVHFDSEGLSDPQLAAMAPALTLVLMLQPPAQGGGLRVWDLRYDGDGEERAAPPGVASVTVPYEAGDVVLIDSHRLHQIEPFSGDTDRVSATVHAACVGGLWESWF